MSRPKASVWHISYVSPCPPSNMAASTLLSMLRFVYIVCVVKLTGLMNQENLFDAITLSKLNVRASACKNNR